MPRTVLVHLNVEVPDGDDRDAAQIGEAVASALDVGSDDDSTRDLRWSVALADEV